MTNVNLTLLAALTRQPVNRLEQVWRRAKKMARIEGQKRNYLVAWHLAMQMCDLKCCAQLCIGDMVTVGRFRGIISDYDEEFAVLDARTRHDDLLHVCAMPVVQVYFLAEIKLG